MNARIAALSIALAGGVHAHPFTMTAWTVDGGGGTSASARFALEGTIGQADADPLDPATSASGRFALTGGFWIPAGASPTVPWLFRDGFESPP